MESNGSDIKEIRTGEEVNPHPLVSAIIPAYNCSGYIAESVAAALSQTFSEMEVIVVNDGSPDTVELEQALSEFFSRIVYISRENGGPGAARNTGIKHARGEYLAFVDGDDIWKPEFVEKQLGFLESKGVDMVYCDAYLFGEVDRPNQTFSMRSPSEGEVTTESLILGTCNVILSGTLVRKSAVVKHGMFTESGLPMAFEDYELWFRLAKGGVKIDFTDEVLLSYRVHKSNLSGSTLKIVERGVAGIRFFVENFDLDEREAGAAECRLAQLESQLALEKAKISIVHGDFEAANRFLEESAKLVPTLKTRVVRTVASVSPAILRGFFRYFRKGEYEQALRESPVFSGSGN